MKLSYFMKQGDVHALHHVPDQTCTISTQLMYTDCHLRCLYACTCHLGLHFRKLGFINVWDYKPLTPTMRHFLFVTILLPELVLKHLLLALIPSSCCCLIQFRPYDDRIPLSYRCLQVFHMSIMLKHLLLYTSV